LRSEASQRQELSWIVSQSVEVTAATLYEAVAQGLAAIRGNEWVAGIAQELNVIKVSVADVASGRRSS
jgi:hypothetical protein